ncbi:hypothetical protein Sjap_009384 [Stephania japonica]|uniref:FAR1 domain-containing protein n=1 Tax=Stephania japonica TaxID=461633 RepID=A0AAP0PFG7_9MAGN
MDLETRACDAAGMIDDSIGGELFGCEIEAIQEPYEGMVFESEDVAKFFYDEYARRIGFISRIVSSRRSERDGSFISRKLACNKEGFNLNSRKIDRVRIRKRHSQREGCMAMMLVKRQKPGKWIVTKFVKDHNHPMVVNCSKERPTPAYSFQSSKQLKKEPKRENDEKDKKIQELSSELNRANRRLAACQEQLSVFMKLVEDHTQHLTGTVSEIVNNVKELESEEKELLMSDHR